MDAMHPCQAHAFQYLGSMVEGGPRTHGEIAHMLSLARVKLSEHWKYFTSKVTPLSHKLAAYKTYGVSVLTHGFTG